jgi:PEGA domain
MRMRAVSVTTMLLLAQCSGCAVIFRDSHPKVRLESTPSEADATVKGRPVGKTPVETSVDRGGLTVVTYSKASHHEHVGIVKKNVNGAWLTLDIVLCPITLCIPLIVDGATGAWNNVPESYSARLDPVQGASVPPTARPTAPLGTSPSPSPPAPSTMSDSERKATARAAYMEGVTLADAGDCAGALLRFETAQKLFDAPTHVLRIAQCQAKTGKLVEAQESYETLAHANLGVQPPDAFKQAQEAAKKELPAVRARVPTLRVQVTPPPATLRGLVVMLDGKPSPVELLGIARPMNPGTYTITATAQGLRSAPKQIELKEGDHATADVALTRP